MVDREPSMTDGEHVAQDEDENSRAYLTTTAYPQFLSLQLLDKGKRRETQQSPSHYSINSGASQIGQPDLT